MFDRLLTRVLVVLSFATHILALWQMLGRAFFLGVNLGASKWTVLLVVMLVTGLVNLIALIRWDLIVSRLPAIASWPRWLSVPLMIAAPVGLVVCKWFVFGTWLPNIFPALWLLLWSILVLAIGIRIRLVKAWGEAALIAAIGLGVLLRCMDWVPDVSSMPFSLGWSEASRYYYASLLFAQHLYGLEIPLSVLHPTRYLLQAIPFAFPDLPLWAHRLWQVILWAGMTSLTAWVLVRRLKLKGLSGFVTGAWVFIYLLQGAVYYHLLVCVVVVLVGFSSRQIGRSLLIIMLASFWAGMSRLNWFPVPAMLGIALYLLERPYDKSAWYQYWAAPLLWFGMGVGAALAGQVAYIHWSGNAANTTQFASSFTSNLLWYRLFPNATYLPGIILGSLIVSVPLFLLLHDALRGNWRAWHPFRLGGMLLILVILFAGGLLVSIKIGGGGDLHNMDAYILLLGVIALYFVFHRGVPDVAGGNHEQRSFRLYLLAVFIPVYFAFIKLPPTPYYEYEPARVETALSIVQENVAQAARQGNQEILFITQRQLLMFDYVTTAPLTPEYEVITLMEMAMSGNTIYLERFYNDLEAHRFSLIVADIQNLAPEGDDGKSFKEEDQVWDERVGRFLLCYYTNIYADESLNLTLFVPRREPAHCR
jgi:hypothetical protein